MSISELVLDTNIPAVVRNNFKCEDFFDFLEFTEVISMLKDEALRGQCSENIQELKNINLISIDYASQELQEDILYMMTLDTDKIISNKYLRNNFDSSTLKFEPLSPTLINRINDIMLVQHVLNRDYSSYILVSNDGNVCKLCLSLSKSEQFVDGINYKCFKSFIEYLFQYYLSEDIDISEFIREDHVFMTDQNPFVNVTISSKCGKCVRKTCEISFTENLIN